MKCAICNLTGFKDWTEYQEHYKLRHNVQVKPGSSSTDWYAQEKQAKLRSHETTRSSEETIRLINSQLKQYLIG